jgi:hypothetical protein
VQKGEGKRGKGKKWNENEGVKEEEGARVCTIAVMQFVHPTGLSYSAERSHATSCSTAQYDQYGQYGQS